METVSLDCKYGVIKLTFISPLKTNNNIKSDNFKPSGGHCGRDCMISG
jgi:hypothetical protein